MRLLVCMLLVHCVASFVLRSPLRAFMPKSLRKTDHRPAIGTSAFAHSGVSDVMHRIKSCVIAENNVPETLKNLIQYGDQWYLGNEPTKTERSAGWCASDSQFERVTGCTSVVQIKTSLVPMKAVSLNTGILDQHERRVQVEGSADSRVTQGMLAILCRVRTKDEPYILCNFLTLYKIHNTFRFLTGWS